MWQLTEPFHIFTLYAALNALIMLVLGVLVTRARVVTQTDIGDGGRPEMAGPLRAHANNTEWVPMAMILLWLFCPLGGSGWVMHAMGATLTIGRILHAIGLSRSTGPTPLRFLGMVLTWIAYIIGIVGVLYFAFFAAAPAVDMTAS
ncbi:MAG TPA: MAPEG family protein [Rhizomicrobium sp.]|nr:MAPEG family protein [Rhizomicrobium sp.]